MVGVFQRAEVTEVSDLWHPLQGLRQAKEGIRDAHFAAGGADAQVEHVVIGAWSWLRPHARRST